MDGTNSDGVDVYEEKGIEETYLFGTDALGRDIWTRTWTGARVSLFIALLAAVFDLTYRSYLWWYIWLLWW